MQGQGIINYIKISCVPKINCYLSVLQMMKSTMPDRHIKREDQRKDAYKGIEYISGPYFQ
jgi:hypothetical protein